MSYGQPPMVIIHMRSTELVPGDRSRVSVGKIWFDFICKLSIRRPVLWRFAVGLMERRSGRQSPSFSADFPNARPTPSKAPGIHQHRLPGLLVVRSGADPF